MKIALAGLDPAIHVFVLFLLVDKDVDPRVKPAGGMSLWLFMI
jgi:hypothetical protein